MVDSEGLLFEEDEHENREDSQRNELLNHLELPKIEGSAVFDETDPVSRHHERVFDQSDAPTEQNDQR